MTQNLLLLAFGKLKAAANFGSRLGCRPPASPIQKCHQVGVLSLKFDLAIETTELGEDKLGSRGRAQDKVLALGPGQQLTQTPGAPGNFNRFHNSNSSPRRNRRLPFL